MPGSEQLLRESLVDEGSGTPAQFPCKPRLSARQAVLVFAITLAQSDPLKSSVLVLGGGSLQIFFNFKSCSILEFEK